MVLQPQDLWDLHLDRHRPTDVTQKVMLGVVDLLVFLLRTVVQPEHDVAVIAVFVVKVGTRDALGLVGVLSEDGEGAGGIKRNAPDRGGVDVMLVHGRANAVAQATPHIGGRLLLT